jgi:murein tripeptide amidase MpaA
VRVYYKDRTESIRLLLSFKAQLLETHVGVDRGSGYHVMQLLPNEIDRITRAGFHVQADPEWQPQQPPAPQAPASEVQTSSIPGYPCYRTVEATYADAWRLARANPQLVTWLDIGNSWQKTARLGGYDIVVLRLTNRDVLGPKPVLLLNAATHAREYTTAELVVRFVESMVENYGKDPDVTWILDYHEVHAVLYANPDGRKQAEIGLSWRKNTNQNYCQGNSDLRGADLNRNFDFQWACCNGSSPDECALDYRGPTAASEPETKVLQRYMMSIFADQRGPKLRDAAPDDASGLFIDVHSYGQLVLWPWGYTRESAPNAAQLQTLGRKLAYWNGYTPHQAIGLYPVDGASTDYAYGQLGVAAYTLELGTSFFQPCDTFEATILPRNLPVLRYAAKAARAPYLTPSGPDSLHLALSAQTVPAGTPVVLQALIDDARCKDGESAQAIVAAEWSAGTPPWQAGSQPSAMAASDGAWDSSQEIVEAVVDTTGWSPGRHTLYVRGQDADGHWGAPSALFMAISHSANDVPVATFGFQCRGTTCEFDASRSFDRDGHIVAYAWTFGDSRSGNAQRLTYSYAQGGTYLVTLSTIDDDRARATQTQTITVEERQQSLYIPYVHVEQTAR